MIDRRPRLSIDISEEQDAKLRELVPWGLKKQLFSKVIDELIELLEEHGEMAIGALLAGKIRFLDIMKKGG